MGVLPNSRVGQLEWFEARINGWLDNAASIGLTTAQVTGLQTLINTARATFTASESARAASKSATMNFYNAMTAMRTPGRAYIAVIKAFAEATNNPAVYAIAQVEPPAPPTPVPAPDMPGDFSGSVGPTGFVTLTWSATPSGPTSGVFFLVSRKREGETGFTFVGGTPSLSFIDPAADVCAGAVMYQVRAQRGEQASEWTTPLSFDLGNGPGLVGVDAVAGVVGPETVSKKLVA